MPAFLLPLALTGISALSGLLGGRKKTATQQQDTVSNSTSTQNVDLYDNPIFSDEQSTGYASAINALLNQLNGGTDLTGYKATGLRELGRQKEMQQKLLQNNLAARGLNNSPAAAAILARNEDAAAGREFDFVNSIPLLQRQLTGETALNLVRAASSMPTGSHRTGTTTQTTTGRSSTTGTATQPGDMLGGLFSGLGQGIAATWGKNWALDEAMKRYPNLFGGGGGAGAKLNV